MKFSCEPEVYRIVKMSKDKESEKYLIIGVDDEQLTDDFLDRLIPIENGHRIEMNKADIINLLNSMSIEINRSKAAITKNQINDILNKAYGETRTGVIVDIDFDHMSVIDTSDGKFLLFINEKEIIYDANGIFDRLSNKETENNNVNNINDNVYILGLIEKGSDSDDTRKYVILDIRSSKDYAESIANKIENKDDEYKYIAFNFSWFDEDDIRRQYFWLGINKHSIKVVDEPECENFKGTYEHNKATPQIGDVLYYIPGIRNVRLPEFKLSEEPRVTKIGKMCVNVN